VTRGVATIEAVEAVTSVKYLRLNPWLVNAWVQALAAKLA